MFYKINNSKLICLSLFCFQKPKPIHFGSNLRGKGWSTKHTAVFKHPKFVHNKIKDRVIHDIALIKLENPVPSEIGTPIKLPNNPPVSNYDKFNATMIGWGYNSIPFLAPSDYLLEAKLVMGGNLPYTFCQIPGKLCSLVSTDEGPRMAPGDSGGPLFFEVNNEFIQIGIITVLWLHPLKAYINEFTDVAYYSKWVNTIMSTH